ncbi:substrate-binding domain-containing protein [Streptomyces cinnamoneus]|uniref:substrate-binding domain-containing protein n=1 Tax=Streptomyces cinnamoneus TaxID=53446 RepID=UPI003F4CF800
MTGVDDDVPGRTPVRNELLRIEGAAKSFPGVRALDGVDLSLRAGEVHVLLGENGDVCGVFAANDEMALGAAKALGARSGKDVRVVAFDGTPDGVAAVRGGTLTATVAQQPKLLGRQAVEWAVKASRGEKLPGRVKVSVVLVTGENAAKFDG